MKKYFCNRYACEHLDCPTCIDAFKPHSPLCGAYDGNAKGDYVKREAIYNALISRHEEILKLGIVYGYGFDRGVDFVREIIGRTPSADVVEVVRCGECKHWLNNHLCKKWSVYGSIETLADGFCYVGERKDNE